jgi:hypothetical protein
MPAVLPEGWQFKRPAPELLVINVVCQFLIRARVGVKAGTAAPAALPEGWVEAEAILATDTSK